MHNSFMEEQPIDWKSVDWVVGGCSRCRGPIHNAPFRSLSEFGDFCSRVCRDVNKPKARQVGGRPRLTKKQARTSAKVRVEYQRDYMRSTRMLAKNPSQDTETKEFTHVKS